MNKRMFLIFMLLSIVGIFIAGWLTRRETEFNLEPITINGKSVPPLPTLDAILALSGEELYAQYCAECHGTKLEGNASWQQRLPDGKLPPPPQDSSGHTWHHPDDILFDQIRSGGNPSFSDMPPYQGILNNQEISAILEFIKSSWGQEEREFQWWITATSNGNIDIP